MFSLRISGGSPDWQAGCARWANLVHGLAWCLCSCRTVRLKVIVITIAIVIVTIAIATIAIVIIILIFFIISAIVIRDPFPFWPSALQRGGGGPQLQASSGQSSLSFDDAFIIMQMMVHNANDDDVTLHTYYFWSGVNCPPHLFHGGGRRSWGEHIIFIKIIIVRHIIFIKTARTQE